MYQKPDFMKISIKAQDVFSSYAGCPNDEGYVSVLTDPCDNDPNMKEIYGTFIEFGWGYQCYSSEKP